MAADVRAENGAEQNRLNMTSALLMQNQTNLEAAHGRIMDADIALESTRLARQNVLVQFCPYLQYRSPLKELKRVFHLGLQLLALLSFAHGSFQYTFLL